MGSGSRPTSSSCRHIRLFLDHRRAWRVAPATPSPRRTSVVERDRRSRGSRSRRSGRRRGVARVGREETPSSGSFEFEPAGDQHGDCPWVYMPSAGGGGSCPSPARAHSALQCQRQPGPGVSRRLGDRAMARSGDVPFLLGRQHPGFAATNWRCAPGLRPGVDQLRRELSIGYRGRRGQAQDRWERRSRRCLELLGELNRPEETPFGRLSTRHRSPRCRSILQRQLKLPFVLLCLFRSNPREDVSLWPLRTLLRTLPLASQCWGCRLGRPAR
jgi:hypothetical protein